MFARRNKISLKRIALLTAVAVGSAGLMGCQQGQSSQTYPYSKLENDVYNCVDKFSREIPKGFVEEEVRKEGTSQVYWYHDRDLDVDSWPASTKARMVRYQRYVGAQGNLVAAYVNVNVDDLEDITKYVNVNVDDFDDLTQTEKREVSAKLLKLKPNSFLGFKALRSLGEYDDPEGYALQKGADAIYYGREKRGASWIRYEAYDMEGPFIAEEKQLLGGKKVPAEQVQRYVDLANRFDKTYSLPKGEPE